MGTSLDDGVAGLARAAAAQGEVGAGEEGQASVVVTSGSWIGLRAAAELVGCVMRFPCEVWISTDQKRANGRSILEVLGMSAGVGVRLTIEAKGERAEEAVRTLAWMIADGASGRGAS